MSWSPTINISGLNTKKSTTASSSASSASLSRANSAAPQQATAQPAATTTTPALPVTSAAPQPSTSNATASPLQQPPLASTSNSTAAAAQPMTTTRAPSLPAASSSTAAAVAPRQTSREPLFIPSPPPVNSDDDSDDLSEQPDSDEDQLAGYWDAAPAAGPVASTSRLPAVASPAARASTNHFGSPAGGSKSGSKPGSPKKPRARPSGAGGGIFVGAIPPLPHYEIKHSSPDSQSNPHRIKIKSGVTDGLKKNWPDPATTQPGGLIDGRTNWYELQPPNEGKHLSWRQNLGKELATKLELEKTTAGGKPGFWILDAFPEGYQFTVHHSSGKSNGIDRLDAYLFGSPATNKFRTVNEYIPHLVWLLTQGPNERIRCHCKYCAKKTQTEVNADIGLEVHSGKRGSSVGGGSSAGGSKSTKKVKKDHFADVDDDPTGFLADKTRRGKQQQLKKVKRSASPSYKGAYVNKERDTDLSDGALYRRGELVWVELPEPLVDPQDPTMRITHWIGVVADRTIKVESRNTAPLQPGAPPQLANKQQFTYRCQLLGLQDELTRAEPHVQAWLAVPSPSALLTVTAMVAQSSVKHAWTGETVRRPRLDEFESVGEAITTFALASQIAAHLIGAFSMVDRYKIDRSHIRARAELDPLDKLKVEKTLQFFHYQCLWWGGERIWSGELVRVLTDDDIFPAGCLPRSPGAETRSLFLRVDTIYKDSESDQAKVAGRLYELRDLKGVTVIEGDAGGSAMSKFETTTTKHATNGHDNSNGGLSPSTTTSNTNSSPVLLDHHLPAPPPGYEFRLLTPVGSHATFDAEYLAGRYYELPTQFRKRETIDAVLLGIGEEQDVVDAQLTVEIRAMALAGLTRARVLYMAASTWTSDRLTTVRNAEEKSEKEMTQYFQKLQTDSVSHLSGDTDGEGDVGEGAGGGAGSASVEGVERAAAATATAPANAMVMV